MVAQSALGGAEGEVMPDAVAGADPGGAVIHPHGAGDGEGAFGKLEPAAVVVRDWQQVGHEVELPLRQAEGRVRVDVLVTGGKFRLESGHASAPIGCRRILFGGLGVASLVPRTSYGPEMRFLYNFLFNVGFVLSAPFYFLKMRRRGNWRTGFGERFGQYDGQIKTSLTNRKVIWLHAVSVGEVGLATELVRRLEVRLPNHKLVVSTTTTTGRAELDKQLPAHIGKIYYPIDRRKHVQRSMGSIHPQAMVFVEAELWPNMLWTLQKRGIPHFLVNARISDRSFRGYRRAGFLFRRLFAGFTGVGVQNEADAQRLRQLGVRPEVIEVVGSLKFDSAGLKGPARLDVSALLAQLGVGGDALVLVGGSTHAGEELLLAQLTRRLRARFPRLFTVLVPRHQERGGEVGRELAAHGVKFRFRNEITQTTQLNDPDLECLVVNTTGELRFFYGRADVVFVGKSLTAEGGQNPIEPAALGKPVVFGPNMQNFPQVVPQFLARDGARQVADAAALEREIERLLGNPDERAAIGQRGQTVVRENLGGLDKTVEMIVRQVSADEP
jgi:3-deoxy-D-manno-octulosonic-acid transferase